MTLLSLMRYSDPRTGKHYALQVQPEFPPELALIKMAEQAERDYQMTLPPERRAVANKPTDFKCPHCKTDKEPRSRKVTKTSGGGFLFFMSVHTEIVDIFRCVECGREFEADELSRKSREVEHQNWSALCMEKYKDGEITDEVLVSLVSAHN